MSYVNLDSSEEEEEEEEEAVTPRRSRSKKKKKEESEEEEEEEEVLPSPPATRSRRRRRAVPYSDEEEEGEEEAEEEMGQRPLRGHSHATRRMDGMMKLASALTAAHAVAKMRTHTREEDSEEEESEEDEEGADDDPASVFVDDAAEESDEEGHSEEDDDDDGFVDHRSEAEIEAEEAEDSSSMDEEEALRQRGYQRPLYEVSDGSNSDFDDRGEERESEEEEEDDEEEEAEDEAVRALTSSFGPMADVIPMVEPSDASDSSDNDGDDGSDSDSDSGSDSEAGVPAAKGAGRRGRAAERAAVDRLVDELAAEVHGTFHRKAVLSGDVPDVFLERGAADAFGGVFRAHPMVAGVGERRSARAQLRRLTEVMGSRPARPLFRRLRSGAVEVARELHDDAFERAVASDPVAQRMKHAEADVVAPPLTQKAMRAAKRKADREAGPESAGAGWFDLPGRVATEEEKNDLRVIAMRQHLEARRFYKKDRRRHKFPKHFHVGTVVEGPTEFYSARIQKRDRKKNYVDEILADTDRKKFLKRKFVENQTVYRKRRGGGGGGGGGKRAKRRA